MQLQLDHILFEITKNPAFWNKQRNKILKELFRQNNYLLKCWKIGEAIYCGIFTVFPYRAVMHLHAQFFASSKCQYEHFLESCAATLKRRFCYYAP